MVAESRPHGCAWAGALRRSLRGVKPGPLSENRKSSTFGQAKKIEGCESVGAAPGVLAQGASSVPRKCFHCLGGFLDRIDGPRLLLRRRGSSPGVVLGGGGAGRGGNAAGAAPRRA